MTLGQNGRSATLTMLQKAGIYRKAMEEMRDHLEQVHVGYQRADPHATYMIEGLVDIYEAMLRDFVVHGVPEDVGSPSHVKERFGSLTDEQRESLVEFFADDPEWRQRTRSEASGTLEDEKAAAAIAEKAAQEAAEALSDKEAEKAAKDAEKAADDVAKAAAKAAADAVKKIEKDGKETTKAALKALRKIGE